MKQLKETILNWPELDRDDEPSQVWIGSGKNTSRPAFEICILNLRELDEGGRTADLLIDVRG